MPIGVLDMQNSKKHQQNPHFLRFYAKNLNVYAVIVSVFVSLTGWRL